MTLSFVAALPINDPEYVFFIMFDEPEVNVKNNFFMRSSNVVGPVISNVISKM